MDLVLATRAEQDENNDNSGIAFSTEWIRAAASGDDLDDTPSEGDTSDDDDNERRTGHLSRNTNHTASPSRNYRHEDREHRSRSSGGRKNHKSREMPNTQKPKKSNGKGSKSRPEHHILRRVPIDEH
ncbi:hypothetical protein NHQ30_005115 [Ciborinia camelliae]|nr:hypothetical protein NHQ30_005115 [Ciborinia camelliae]